jgi:hypothetical protein
MQHLLLLILLPYLISCDCTDWTDTTYNDNFAVNYYCAISSSFTSGCEICAYRLSGGMIAIIVIVPLLIIAGIVACCCCCCTCCPYAQWQERQKNEGLISATPQQNLYGQQPQIYGQPQVYQQPPQVYGPGGGGGGGQPFGQPYNGGQVVYSQYSNQPERV